MEIISLQLVLSWRWRCQSKATIILGPDLCIAGFPTMFRLSDYDAAEIDRDILRCPCGARVIPLASSELRRYRIACNRRLPKAAAYLDNLKDEVLPVS
jgi:hypothetical protein